MKTRQGFVSNSSSSSYIIAFDNEPGDLAAKTFQYVVGTKGKELWDNRSSVAQMRELLTEELKELVKDRNWLSKRIAFYNQYVSSDTIVQIFREMQELDTQFFSSVNQTRFRRQESKISQGRNPIQTLVKDLSYELNKIIERECEIADQVRLLEKLPDDLVIVKCEVVDGDFYLKDLIANLKDSNRITIVECVSR
jgi:hypothetical protein